MPSILLHVYWLVPVVLYILLGFVFARWLGKHLANQPDQFKRLLTNFGFCAAIAAVFALVTGNLRFDAVTLGVCGVGALNGLANIQVWRATKTSLSKTSLLAFGDDIIAILLSIVIIGDGRYLNGFGIAGMLVCFLAGFLFWSHDASAKGRESRKFYQQVLTYSILWGCAIFATRYYAFSDLPVAQFIFGWYFGSFATVFVAFVWNRLQGGGKEAVSFSLKEYAQVALFACIIMLCLAIEYWAFMLAPLTTVQPVLMTAEGIVPAIVGWTIFKEGKHFDRWQWLFSAIAVIGTILLAISLPHNIR